MRKLNEKLIFCTSIPDKLEMSTVYFTWNLRNFNQQKPTYVSKRVKERTSKDEILSTLYTLAKEIELGDSGFGY